MLRCLCVQLLIIHSFIHAVYSQCVLQLNLTATGISQEITSPGYPSNYQYDLDCVWQIEADNSSHVIWFSILDLLTDDDSYCTDDKVMLYDGTVSWSTYYASYCGDKIPPAFISSGSLITVRFLTDDYKNSRGFRAVYVSGLESSFGASDTDDSANSSLPVILGSSIGSVVLVVFVIKVIVYKCKRGNKVTAPSSQQRGNVSSCQNQPYGIQRDGYYGDDAPPSYSEIYRTNIPDQTSSLPPPPAYSVH